MTWSSQYYEAREARGGIHKAEIIMIGHGFSSEEREE
jgi:hypothetical protein